MSTPTKYDIMVQARKEMAELQAKAGLPFITPEEHELRESGALRKAQRNLMSSRRYEYEERKYLEQMASGLNLAVIPKRLRRQELQKVEAFESFQKQHPHFIVKTNGFRIAVPNLLKPKRVLKPKVVRKKKRMKNHSGRVGKKPRKLSGFRFGEDVWRVRRK